MKSLKEAKTALIAFVDDHPLFLSGIQHWEADLENPVDFTCYTSGLDLLLALDQGVVFDVIVTDLTMREMNGMVLISAIRQRGIKTPVIILTASEGGEQKAHSELIGAFCYLHKTIDPKVLLNAIVEAKNAGDISASKLQRSSSREISGVEGASQIVVPRLSPRQIRILGLIDRGMSNQEIADALAISENTVKSHAKVIFRELEVTTRTAAASRARTLALI